MRFIIGTAVLITICSAATVDAQEKSCHPVSPTDRVVVTMTEGTKVVGTLLCLNDEAAAVLARDGQIATTPLSRIRTIRTRPDPVWDGALKGAVVPLIFWVVFCHGCEGATGPVLKAAGTYGLMGLTWDALQTNQKTIYAGSGRSASIAWRVRF
jgi:hypothetical protein